MAKVLLIRELTAKLMSGPKTNINSVFGKEGAEQPKWCVVQGLQWNSLNSLLLYYSISQCHILVNFNMELEIAYGILQWSFNVCIPDIASNWSLLVRDELLQYLIFSVLRSQPADF